MQSKAAIEEVVNALSWLHQVAGWGTRILAQPKVRKEPVTAEMLKAMVDAAGPEPSLSEVRLLAVCLLAFAGFLRCEKLLKLVCADVQFNQEGLVLSIKSCKTYQFREGASLVVARIDDGMYMGSLSVGSNDRVFRAVVCTKKGERLRKSGGLSYSRLRELLLEKISQLGRWTHNCLVCIV